MNKTSHLPYRLSEKAFRLYEPFVILSVERFPDLCVHDPKTIMVLPTTFAARLRDALLSLYKYRWPTKVNMTKFDEIWNYLKVKHANNGMIVTGDNATVRSYGVEAPTPTTSLSGDVIQFESLDQMKNLCELSAKHLLTKATISGLSDEVAAKLEANYDVRLDKNQDGTFTLS